MKTADVNINLINSYFEMLKNLSFNNKLELITKLSNSMKTVKNANSNSIKSLYGSLITDQSSDEFIDEMKKSRIFISNRFII
jgi:hypothetical protein